MRRLPQAPVRESRMENDIDGYHVRRPAEHWRSIGGQRVRCDLCYRLCELAPGAAGPCGYRLNDRGRMTIPHHGEVSELQLGMSGFAVSGFLTYKPGALTLGCGGLRCTARCVFCISGAAALAAEHVPWAANPLQPRAEMGERALCLPRFLPEMAQHMGATELAFATNEPTLTFEFLLEAARGAQRAGLGVMLPTNGLCTPVVVRELAPYVGAVQMGVKGSADAAFYERYMHAPGAVPAVLASARAWLAGGTHVIVSDLIAPPHMQDDAASEAAQTALYRWVRAELGPLTPVLLLSVMRRPPEGGLWVDADAELAYTRRVYRALSIAQSEGLAYARLPGAERIVVCHACGGVLVHAATPKHDCDVCRMAVGFCPYWQHEQHVTAGRCDHCGAVVPVVALSAAELATARARVRAMHGDKLAEARELWRRETAGPRIALDEVYP